MQKAKNIISALLTLLVIGAFHHVNQKSEEVETVTTEQGCMNQIPYVVPEPMVGYPIY
jgi:hypothetical protein